LLCITALLAFHTDKLSHVSLHLICLGLGIFSSAIVVIGFTTVKEQTIEIGDVAASSIPSCGATPGGRLEATHKPDPHERKGFAVGTRTHGNCQTSGTISGEVLDCSQE